MCSVGLPPTPSDEKTVDRSSLLGVCSLISVGSAGLPSRGEGATTWTLGEAAGVDLRCHIYGDTGPIDFRRASQRLNDHRAAQGS